MMFGSRTDDRDIHMVTYVTYRRFYREDSRGKSNEHTAIGFFITNLTVSLIGTNMELEIN